MTITAEVEVPIARPVEAVWSELTAVERFPEWLFESGIKVVERLDPGPLEKGTRLRIRQQLPGLGSVLEGQVTIWEPPSRFGFEARSAEGIAISADAQLVPEDVVTRVRWSLRIGLPLRLRLFESMATPEVRRAAVADLVALKRRLEQVAG